MGKGAGAFPKGTAVVADSRVILGGRTNFYTKYQTSLQQLVPVDDYTPHYFTKIPAGAKALRLSNIYFTAHPSQGY